MDRYRFRRRSLPGFDHSSRLGKPELIDRGGLHPPDLRVVQLQQRILERIVHDQLRSRTTIMKAHSGFLSQRPTVVDCGSSTPNFGKARLAITSASFDVVVSFRVSLLRLSLSSDRAPLLVWPACRNIQSGRASRLMASPPPIAIAIAPLIATDCSPITLAEDRCAIAIVHRRGLSYQCNFITQRITIEHDPHPFSVCTRSVLGRSRNARASSGPPGLLRSARPPNTESIGVLLTFCRTF